MVVGFSWPIVHENAAAAIVDGELVFASEEERHTRHKHARGEPPVNSTVKLFQHLRKMGIKPADVDAYACHFSPRLFNYGERRDLFFAGLTKVLTGPFSYMKAFSLASAMLSGFEYTKLANDFFKMVFELLGEQVPPNIKLVPVEHHLAHAASAYYFSGHNDAAILTMDGAGEQDSTVVWKVKNGEFEKALSMHASYGSVGWLYQAVCAKLGYDVNEGPGKVMGLAPYGGPSRYYDALARLLRRTRGADLPFFIGNEDEKQPKRRGVNYIFELVDRAVANKIDWNPKEDLSKDAANLAWAVQKVCEDAVLATARWTKQNVSSTALGLAGGVALNAKANMEMHYSRLFDDLFIFPAANDAGAVIGAAAYVHEHVCGGKMTQSRMTSTYLGPEYTDEEVRACVEASKWNAEFIGNDVGEVAELVSRGRIVTWYQGRAELGPRALGNRSIVADPRMKETWAEMNKVKGREWWRPLAPSLLDVDRYFLEAKPHEFMVMMYKFKDDAGDRVPAVCHVDSTARPQTLTAKWNPTWGALIKSFGEMTGEELIVNTSFNLAGEPLVETPREAMRSFAIGGFDAIYLQGWLIKKPKSG